MEASEKGQHGVVRPCGEGSHGVEMTNKGERKRERYAEIGGRKEGEEG